MKTRAVNTMAGPPLGTLPPAASRGQCAFKY